MTFKFFTKKTKNFHKDYENLALIDNDNIINNKYITDEQYIPIKIVSNKIDSKFDKYTYNSLQDN
jgi:hypothetical protein